VKVTAINKFKFTSGLVIIIVIVNISHGYFFGANREFKKLLQAATKGNVDAQVKLGNKYMDIYMNSNHDRGYYDKAIYWYQKVTDCEHPEVMAALGFMYLDSIRNKNETKGIELLRKAAAKGNLDAYEFLGIAYLKGIGVTQSYSKAIELLQKATIGHHRGSQAVLAAMYLEGLGVPKNHKKAFDLMQQAAIQGELGAQADLGVMYEKGDGVTQDYVKAVEWYQKAAIKNYYHAQFNLGSMYQEGKGVAKSYAKAAHWYRKAASQRMPEANLIMMYISSYALDDFKKETTLIGCIKRIEDLVLIYLDEQYIKLRYYFYYAINEITCFMWS
jgi:TPR repeat protein